MVHLSLPGELQQEQSFQLWGLRQRAAVSLTAGASVGPTAAVKQQVDRPLLSGCDSPSLGPFESLFDRGTTSPVGGGGSSIGAKGVATSPNRLQQSGSAVARYGVASEVAAKAAAVQRKLQEGLVKESAGALGGATTGGQYLPQLGTSARLLTKSSTGGLMGRLDLRQALISHGLTGKPA